MSILIKGADMPENCGICNALYHGVICHVVFKSPDERPKSCPLVEVPEPHGRLIDANELETKHHWTDDYYETEYVEMEDIDNAPTVIEAEEQEHDCCKSEEEKE